ncbi:MAG: hypothetical protein ACYCOS_04135 [Sulfobacillus sp.]
MRRSLRQILVVTGVVSALAAGSDALLVAQHEPPPTTAAQSARQLSQVLAKQQQVNATLAATISAQTTTSVQLTAQAQSLEAQIATGMAALKRMNLAPPAVLAPVVKAQTVTGASGGGGGDSSSGGDN